MSYPLTFILASDYDNTTNKKVNIYLRRSTIKLKNGSSIKYRVFKDSINDTKKWKDYEINSKITLEEKRKYNCSILE